MRLRAIGVRTLFNKAATLGTTFGTRVNIDPPLPRQ
jgi:hypothetical protein